MPRARAQALLNGLRSVERGEGRAINGVNVWDSDRAWAALLSLAGPEALYETARLDWKMPPRGLSNPGVAERYGDAAQHWVNLLLDRKSLGPGYACLAATILATNANTIGFRAALRLDELSPEQLLLWQWLKKHPLGWTWLAGQVARGEPRAIEAMQRLASTDAKGAFLALAAKKDEATAQATFERAGVAVPKGLDATRATRPGARTTISIGVIEPHFKDFTYPMWDNANYFTGAMRVTGYVSDRGEALVWEQLMTGLGDGGVVREVTVHPSFPMRHTWGVHREVLLSEKEVIAWDGDDEVSALTGVRRTSKGKHVTPPDGIKTQALVKKIGAEVPIAIDTSGLSRKDAEKLLSHTGPAERVMIRLGQAPYRAKVFPKLEQLAKEAKLPADAKALFSFDVFRLPNACEPAGSSPDIVAMVDALAAREKLVKLPSHGLHPLASLMDRIHALGGWGDKGFCAP